MANLEIKKVTEEDETGRIIQREFANECCDGFVLVGPEETTLPRYYEHFAKSIANFEIRNSDILLCSFPKTGSTWVQEMMWLIVNNLNFEGAKTQVALRFPVFELCTLFDFEKLQKILGRKLKDQVWNSMEYLREQQSPRLVKTHLPFSLLPRTIQNGTTSPKMVYVMRNPKDVCVSYYHYGRLIHGWRANLDNFVKVFMTNKIQYGSFWKHVLGYWKQRNLPNLLIITYEEMKRDLPSVIKKVASFLGRSLTEEQVQQLCHHLSFDQMKTNKSVNCEEYKNERKQKKMLQEDRSFIRSGTVGKYKEELSSENIEKLDRWVKQNIGGSDFDKEYGYSHM